MHFVVCGTDSERCIRLAIITHQKTYRVCVRVRTQFRCHILSWARCRGVCKAQDKHPDMTDEVCGPSELDQAAVSAFLWEFVRKQRGGDNSSQAALEIA